MAELVAAQPQRDGHHLEVSDELLRLLRGINEKLERHNHAAEAEAKVATGANKTDKEALNKPKPQGDAIEHFRWYEHTHRGQNWIGSFMPESLYAGELMRAC
jgi:hypothetical protein